MLRLLRVSSEPNSHISIHAYQRRSFRLLKAFQITEFHSTYNNSSNNVFIEKYFCRAHFSMSSCAPTPMEIFMAILSLIIKNQSTFPQKSLIFFFEKAIFVDVRRSRSQKNLSFNFVSLFVLSIKLRLGNIHRRFDDFPRCSIYYSGQPS